MRAKICEFVRFPVVPVIAGLGGFSIKANPELGLTLVVGAIALLTLAWAGERS